MKGKVKTMKKLRKLSFRTLAVILSVLMVVYLLPLSVFADGVTKSGENSEGSSADYSYPEYSPMGLGNKTEADALFEDDNLRKSNVKYFLMDDGSYTAAVYPGAVHYLDESGKWQDIDNTLESSGSEYSTGNARIKLAKKITGNESLFTLHDGNRKITMSLIGARKKTTGTVTNTAPESGEATQLQKLMTLNKLSSRVMYADILDGADLEYVLDGGNVKENIIVKERKDTYSYSFTLALNNLTAELTDNEVILKDSGEIFYTIPAPYMYDAAGAYSEAAEYTLENNGNGKYTLTVTADSEWMNASGRAFPVTIDPPLMPAEALSVAFEHASVRSVSNTCVSGSLYVGYREGDGLCRGYIHISGIGTLTAPLNITEVQLGYVQNSFMLNGTENSAESTGKLNIVLKHVLSWNSSTLTWMSHPAEKTDSKAFNSANGTATGTRCYWDITDMLKSELYNNSDDLYLMMQTYNDCFSTGGDNLRRGFTVSGNAGQLPALIVRGNNSVGLESHWTTTDHRAGFAGSGYVNNRTGALTFVINTLSTTDSLMPTGFPLVYNSAYAGAFATSNNSALPNARGVAGKGFKLGIHETIVPYTINGIQYYMYTDSDGTEHLFRPVTSTRYEDMDGLGLTLEVDRDNYLYAITDRAGNWYGYTLLTDGTYGGCLVNITTPDGNTLMIDCAGIDLRASQIRLKPNGQNPFVQMTMEYNTAGLISRVYNPHTHEAYIFYYSTTYNGSYGINNSGFLRKMVYVKGTGSTTASEWNNYLPTTTGGSITKIAEATYSYNSLGRLITARDDTAGQEIRYTYDSSGRISAVTEYAGTGSMAQGQKLGFSYFSEATRIQSSGSDDVYGNSDDLYTNYVFDSRGRTVNAYTTDYSEKVLYGASSAQYEDENENAKNNVKFGISTNGTYPNLLYNGAFEIKGNTGSTIPGWTKSGNVTHITGTYAFDSGKAQLSGSGAYIYQDVTLAAGRYALSFNATCGGDVTGLNVKVEKSAGGTVLLNETLTKSSMNADSLSSNFSYVFEVASGGNYRIKFTLYGATGAVVSLDNVMLTKSSAVSQMSFLEDGGFENSSRGAWSTYSTASSGSVFGSSARIGNGTAYSTIENKVFSVPSSVDYDYLPTAQSKVMTLYGWAKKSDAYNYNGAFRMRVDVKYNMGSSYITESFGYDFCKDTTGWQYGSVSFDIQSGRLVEIKVVLEYDCGYGEVYFDDIVLTSDESRLTAYGYTPAGMLSYSRSGYDQSWYYYNADNDLAMNVYSKLGGRGSVSAYEYNNKRQVTRDAQYTYTGAYNAENMHITGTYLACTSFTNYTYNGYGMLTQKLTFAPDKNVNSISAGVYTVSSDLSGGSINFNNYTASLYNNISSKTTYNTTSGSPYFGAVTMTEDSLGKQTRYFYNADGRLRAVIYPDSTGVTYTYDAKGNTESVLPAKYTSGSASAVTSSASVSYDYDAANRLSKITTESTEYRFEYNSFGSTTKISAGSNTLASYTYNSYNGKLNTLTYGNGDGVKYTYDELDRVKQIEYNNGTGYAVAVKYTYNSDGKVQKMEDMLAGEVTCFTYDSSGRLTGSSKRSADGSEVYAEKRVSYDSDDRLSSVRYTIGESEIIGGLYTYDTRGRLNRYKIISGTLTATEDITYDGFSRPTGRAMTVKFQNTTAFEVSQSYEYKANGKSQSALVSKLTSNFNGNTSVYNISYDSTGNITSISDNAGVVQSRYEYDDLNQLVREDNRALGKSYTYTYDDAGNILSKKVYSFTTGTLGTPIDTVSYSYNGDRLTNYDGQSITYDTIGNPTNYRGYTVTWKNGRQLAEMQYKDGDTLSYPKLEYTYNADGMITGVRHCYYINGSTEYYYDSEYITDGTRVLAYRSGDDRGSFYAEYLYDESGSPMGMKYYAYNFETNQTETTCAYYFFEKNIFGDIVGVYDEDGNKVLGFTYDAWGNFSITETSEISGLYEGYRTFLTKACIFRYRGYMYESSSELYFLQTRFYDPVVGRFINADGYVSTGAGLLGYNMYAYCNNNPVNYIDPTGEFLWILVVALIVVTPLVLSGCSSEETELDVINGIDETSPLYKGRFATLDEAVDGMALKVGDYLADDSKTKEAGGFIYKLNDGYYVSRLQSGILATEISIKIDLSNAPKGAEIIGTYHSHPYHNNNIIYTEFEYIDVVNSGITSYVVDSCGCIYALYPDAKNYMDYVKIK